MASNDNLPSSPATFGSDSSAQAAVDTLGSAAAAHQPAAEETVQGDRGGPSQRGRAFESRHLVWAGLFMLAGISFLIFLGRERSSVAGQQVGDLDIQPLLNTETGLASQDMRGKLVLFHFWGPWCPPCIDEYPEIIKLQRKYEEHPDVLVVSVSCDSKVPENAADLSFDTKRVLQGVAADLKIYSDPAQYSRIQIANLLGRAGFAYPTSLLVDRQMKVLQTWVGATREGEIEKEIQRALKTSKPGSSREP